MRLQSGSAPCWFISKGLLLGFRTRRNAKKKEQSPVSAELQDSSQWAMQWTFRSISLQMMRNQTTTNWRRRNEGNHKDSLEPSRLWKASRKRKKRSLHKPSEACHRNPNCVKFAVPNFMKWTSDERAYYPQKLQKTTMEELYAAENPESLGLIPEIVIRRQEVSLVEEKSAMAPSHFDDSVFEVDREAQTCLMTRKRCQRNWLLAVLQVLRKMINCNTCPVVPAEEWLKRANCCWA